jgi:ribosomal protein S15P/S13E
MPKKVKGKKSESNEEKQEKISKKQISSEEFDKKVIELAKQGLTSEKIGERLRREGIHPKEYNKKISRILKESNLYANPDLKNIEEKLSRIKKHYEKNKQDKRASKEKDRIFSQLRILKKYNKIATR